MGPLKGIRIVELAGIGPGPFCAMLLADLGAEIIRIDRLEASDLGVAMDPAKNLANRSRPSLAVDLKSPEGIETVLKLIAKADALIEGFRPGVMERLGLGPDAAFARNPKLVYGRMTGWGQSGPLAPTAGHDLNYIALSGALHSVGRPGQRPVPPLNLVGDFGGGSLYLAVGILAALLEARGSGKGQVVDAAMTDGAASLMTMFYGLLAAGRWQDKRGVNLLDGGSPWYDTYECADGKYVALGAIEPKFWADFCTRTGLADDPTLPRQYDFSKWGDLRDRLTALFKTKTRDDWAALLDGSDACFAPVLSLSEAPHHPHNQARGTFVERDGVVQPAPAPRFSRTPGGISRSPTAIGEGGVAALHDWGFDADAVAALLAAGTIKGGPA